LQRAIEKDMQLARMRYPSAGSPASGMGHGVFLLHTGLRLSEALTLQLGDVQLAERKGAGVGTTRQGRQGAHRTVERAGP